MPAPKSMAVSVRVLEQADYPELARFLAEQTQGVLDEGLWLDRFELFWETNPNRQDTEARGWVLTDGQRILGFFGNIPMCYCLDGVETTVYGATSWYVSENVRRRSLELLLPFFSQANGLHTTPTAAVSKILSEFECVRLDRPWTNYELLLPVDTSAFAELAALTLADKGIRRWAIQQAVGAAVRTWSAIGAATRLLARRPLGTTFREISEFSADYNTFWLRFSRRHRGLAVRNADQLNWLFFGSTQLRRTRRVVEVRHGAELIGYAAVKRIRAQVANAERHALELVDLVVDDENPETLQAIVNGLLSLVETESVPPAFLRVYPLHPGFAAICKRSGFLVRKREIRYFIKGFSSEGLFSSPLDGDRCFFS